MEEEKNEAEKLVRKYNDFMLAKKIDEELKLPIVFTAIITTIILFLRLQENFNLITFFITFFISIFPIFLDGLISWKYDVFLPENFERTQRYIRHKRKKFIENDIRALEFRKFLEEEGLYGMELGNEELVRFIEWQKKNEMERL